MSVEPERPASVAPAPTEEAAAPADQPGDTETAATAAAADDTAEGSDVEDQRRNAAEERMARIELEFSCLKERLYEEKKLQLNKERQLLRQGEHPELVRQKALLEERCRERVRTAELLRRFQMENIERNFNAEKTMAEADLAASSEGLTQEVAQSLSERQRRMEEEHSTLDLTSDFNSDRNVTMTRKLRKRQAAEVEKLALGAGGSGGGGSGSGVGLGGSGGVGGGGGVGGVGGSGVAGAVGGGASGTGVADRHRRKVMSGALAGPSVIYALSEDDLNDDVEAMRHNVVLSAVNVNGHHLPVGVAAQQQHHYQQMLYLQQQQQADALMQQQQLHHHQQQQLFQQQQQQHHHQQQQPSMDYAYQ